MRIPGRGAFGCSVPMVGSGMGQMHSDEDDAGQRWAEWIAHEWADDVSDPREDVYTLADGSPEKAGDTEQS
jgi:hypothetical protein